MFISWRSYDVYIKSVQSVHIHWIRASSIIWLWKPLSILQLSNQSCWVDTRVGSLGSTEYLPACDTKWPLQKKKKNRYNQQRLVSVHNIQKEMIVAGYRLNSYKLFIYYVHKCSKVMDYVQHMVCSPIKITATKHRAQQRGIPCIYWWILLYMHGQILHLSAQQRQVASFPGPRSAFRRLQRREAGRGPGNEAKQQVLMQMDNP